MPRREASVFRFVSVFLTTPRFRLNQCPARSQSFHLSPRTSERRRPDAAATATIILIAGGSIRFKIERISVRDRTSGSVRRFELWRTLVMGHRARGQGTEKIGGDWPQKLEEVDGKVSRHPVPRRPSPASPEPSGTYSFASADRLASIQRGIAPAVIRQRTHFHPVPATPSANAHRAV